MHTLSVRKYRRAIRWVVLAAGLAAFAAGRAAVAPAQQPPSEVDRRLRELEETVKQLQKDQQPPATTSAEGNKTLLAGWQDGFRLTSSDGQFKLAIGGYLQSDGRFFIDNKSGSVSQFLFRRVRPILEGTVFKYFDFRVMPDFAGSKLVLQDAYVDVNYVREARLQIGKYKPPVGLERLQSARTLLFVERGLPTNLVPQRDTGVQLHGDVLNGAFTYALGVFNGVPDLGNGDTDTNSDKDFAGRVFAQPLKNSGVPPLSGLGLGIGGSYGHTRGSASSTDLPTYVSASQTSFFSYASNSTDASKTAVARGARSRISPQGYYFWGPFGVLTEYVRSSQGLGLAGKSTTAEHHAWQLAGSYVLTGERASYEGVTPAQPFDPWARRWGAWQLVGRYATLDIDSSVFKNGFADPTKSARAAKEWVLGVNWYLNKNVKFALDYANTDFKGGAAKGDRRTEKIVLSRVQLAF